MRAGRRGVATGVLCAVLLAGCGSDGGHRSSRGTPGPPGDPWGPYIKEASQTYSVPEQWVRQVMRQESGGHATLNGRPTTSSAGAMGLMQVMPATYGELSRRHGLGPDPYDPHDNIMAGTAYIREMYDKYGSPGFLAAYNAGPRRMDSYLSGRGNLPGETVNYVASIAPRLGNDRPMTGPLSMFAKAGPDTEAVVIASAAPVRMSPTMGQIVDPDSFVPAYVVPVPDEPRSSAPIVLAQAEPPPTRSALGSAYVPEPAAPSSRLAFPPPSRPPAPSSVMVASVAPSYRSTPQQSRLPAPPPVMAASAAPPQREMFRLVRITPSGQFLPGNAAQPAVLQTIAGGSGDWSIQVGAFNTPMLARAAADTARAHASGTLPATATTAVGAADKPGGGALFRARIAHLSAAAAEASCRTLRAQGTLCVAVPPGRA